MADVFCMIVKGEIPSYKVYEDDICLAFLDINPVTVGHTVIVSKEHYDDILGCDSDVMKHMFEVSQMLGNKYMDKLHCKGINVLTNCKEAAGQSVPHFHIHVIPRYDETDGYNPTFTSKENVDFNEILKQIGA